MNDTNEREHDGSRSVPAQLGYLTRAVEDLTIVVTTHASASANRSDKMDKRLQAVENKLSTATTVWKVIKALLLTVAFVLTFKFGNISSLWR